MGTVGWAVALIVLVAVRDELAPADRWWIWVAAFGCFMGLFGLVYVPHLKRSRERAARRRGPVRQDAAEHAERGSGENAAAHAEGGSGENAPQ